MLTLENLAYRSQGFVLEADLTVPKGARVAVIGPSGAGKSTLLSLIAGFLAPTEGRILWDGRDLTPLQPAARPVAMLFQDNNLFPHLSILHNTALGIRPGLRPRPDELERARAALIRVGLKGMESRKPAALSGGQQSRAALARILVQRRALMLLDELFAALGPALKTEMLDLVAEVAGETGATVLMVSHDPSDALRIAGETIVVAEGRAAPPAPTADLLANPPDALRAYLG